MEHDNFLMPRGTIFLGRGNPLCFVVLYSRKTHISKNHISKNNCSKIHIIKGLPSSLPVGVRGFSCSQTMMGFATSLLHHDLG